MALTATQDPKPDPPPPAPEPEKVIDGSVIGYRAWRIEDWALVGTYADRPWVPGVNEAVCQPPESAFTNQLVYFGAGARPSRHAAPAVGCHCGITALARFAEDDAHWPDDAIRGAIEAWSDETVDVAGPGDVAAAAGVEVKGDPGGHDHGRFILHGTGFRAQYGKVVLLAVDDDWPVAKKAAVRALAQEHGADVCKRSHLKDAALEHGQLVPDEMLEWAKEGDASAETSALAGKLTTLAGQMQVSMRSMQSFGYSVNQLRAALGAVQVGSGSVYSMTTAATPKPKPTGKGISRKIGYPGPPADPTMKGRQGQRVRDSKGQVWQCVRGGKPGQWDLEA